MCPRGAPDADDPASLCGAARADVQGSDSEDEGRAAVFKGSRQPGKSWKASSMDTPVQPAVNDDCKPKRKKKKRKKAQEPDGG